MIVTSPANPDEKREFVVRTEPKSRPKVDASWAGGPVLHRVAERSEGTAAAGYRDLDVGRARTMG